MGFQISIYHSLILLGFITGACSSPPEGQQTAKKAKDSLHQAIIRPQELKKPQIRQDSMIKYPTIILPNHSPNRSVLQAQLASGNPVKIICYGNSITRGYKVGSFDTVAQPYPQVLQKLLAAHYQNSAIQVINQGHNGWRSDQGKLNLTDLVINQKPDWVILEFGINDVYSGFSKQVYQKYMQLIINELQKNKCQIILCSPTPILSSYNSKLLEYSQVLAQLAQQNQCSFVHWHQWISQKAEQAQTKPEDLLPDDIHFADDKYAWLAQAIFDWLQEK
ncbi:MAG: GDSL-type esterase/lipase family protein [Microscillaceae bacterium]|jgi:lysophospholipase L1-like esterase|nr:GDSL-type esterase/lipase family protein [Microscillaceae bacterium]